jgi:hypothetical protein
MVSIGWAYQKKKRPGDQSAVWSLLFWFGVGLFTHSGKGALVDTTRLTACSHKHCALPAVYRGGTRVMNVKPRLQKQCLVSSLLRNHSELRCPRTACGSNTQANNTAQTQGLDCALTQETAQTRYSPPTALYYKRQAACHTAGALTQEAVPTSLKSPAFRK